MKKFIAFIVACITVVTAFAFSACDIIISYSETFVGKISEKSYSNKYAAAEAFVVDELSGSTAKPVFVDYSKTADLTAEELDGLNIPSKLKSDITVAEKGEVLFVENTSEKTARETINDTDLTYKHGLYIFKIASTYRYYVPAQSTGESITRSYYESVFDVEAYRNCTIEAKVISEALGSNGEQSVTAKVEMKYTYRITETAAVIDMQMVTYNGNKIVSDMSGTASLFLLEVGNNFKCFIKNNGNYSEYSLAKLGLNISSMKDIFAANIPSFIDQSYFEKTDTGFKIKDSKSAEYSRNIFKEAGDLINYIGLDGVGVTVESNFFVSKGDYKKPLRHVLLTEHILALKYFQVRQLSVFIVNSVQLV